MSNRSWILKALVSASLATLAASNASAAEIYTNNFENSTSEWSGAGSLVSTLGGSYWYNDSGLVGLTEFASATNTTFSVGNGTQVSSASLSLLFGAIDSWDGNGGVTGPDSFTIKLDGNTVFSKVFANTSGSNDSGLPTPFATGGFAGNVSWSDSLYNLNISLGTLSAGTHTLTFVAGGAGWQGGSDESFALDNIKVQGTIAAVPEPETYAMLLAGLGVLGFMGKRRRAG